MMVGGVIVKFGILPKCKAKFLKMFFYKILYLYTNVSENFNCFLMKLKFKCGYWKKNKQANQH